MKRDLAGEPDVVQRFFNEARAIGAIRHPNIIEIIDVGKLGTVPYLVMELLHGESLSERVARVGPLPFDVAVDFVSQAARALQVAHESGVVYRDLKPENLFIVTDAGRAHDRCARAAFRVSLEIALEWEHLARELDDFYLPHAFMDIRASDRLNCAGFFVVPVGVVNEYLYPDFVRVTGSAPLFSASIVPAPWSEVGLEPRGRLSLPLTASSHLTYAALISNGLEQPDAMPNDGKIAEGGDLKDMRFPCAR